jgi:hypothetical protein
LEVKSHSEKRWREIIPISEWLRQEGNGLYDGDGVVQITVALLHLPLLIAVVGREVFILKKPTPEVYLVCRDLVGFGIIPATTVQHEDRQCHSHPLDRGTELATALQEGNSLLVMRRRAPSYPNLVM